MRAFPSLLKPGGEFLSTLLSIDPMSEDELLARYDRGEKCVPSDINAAAGTDIQEIMHAINQTETLPDYVPPSSRRPAQRPAQGTSHAVPPARELCCASHFEATSAAAYLLGLPSRTQASRVLERGAC